jgi:hypothetical protein
MSRLRLLLFLPAVTLSNIKRGLVRLWIVIAAAADLYLILLSVTNLHDGARSPLDSSWSAFVFIVFGLNVLWFVVLAALLWVLNGFSLKAD